MTLASHASNMWSVWIGSTLGMFAADLLAIGMASYFGKAVPDKVVRGASALLFCIAGVWTLIELYVH